MKLFIIILLAVTGFYLMSKSNNNVVQECKDKGGVLVHVINWDYKCLDVKEIK